MNNDNIKIQIIVKEQKINVLRIDNKEYISFADLGKKCFGINKMEDKEYLNKIIEISKIQNI